MYRRHQSLIVISAFSIQYAPQPSNLMKMTCFPSFYGEHAENAKTIKIKTSVKKEFFIRQLIYKLVF